MSIRDRLSGHIEKNRILSKNQFGFQRNMSTEDCLFEVTKSIYNSIDKNKKPLAIFLDLAKAFDTVSHSLLLKKLNDYGIRGLPNKLIESYLEDRKQCVKIQDQFSSFETIVCGVPQGSVLGPLLFSLYINELLFLDTPAQIISYADDTVILLQGNSWNDVMEQSTSAFAKVRQWLNENLLTINIQKTKFMCYSILDSKQPHIEKIKLHTYECLTINKKIGCTCKDYLDKTKNIKYLGITLDQNIKWEKHIINLNNKIRKLTYRFYYLRNSMPIYILKLLYQALAESIIRYGISIWGGAYVSTLELINVTQRSLLKIIFNKEKRFPTELLFQESQFLTISQLYIKAVLMFVYRHPELKLISNSTYDTRNRIGLGVTIPLLTKTTTQRFITYFGPKFFNLLPPELKKINHRNLFSKKISLFLRANLNIFAAVLGG